MLTGSFCTTVDLVCSIYALYTYIQCTCTLLTSMHVQCIHYTYNALRFTCIYVQCTMFCKCCQSTCTCTYTCTYMYVYSVHCWYDLQAGHTPMHRACSLGCTHSLAALLHHEANLSSLPPSNRHTLTHSEVHPCTCLCVCVCTCVYMEDCIYVGISACKEVYATELPPVLFCGNYMYLEVKRLATCTCVCV